MTASPFGFYFSGLVAMLTVVASQLQLGVSDYIIIVGAVAFGLASLRTGRMKVLRDTNIDLVHRNVQLENTHLNDIAELAKKEAELVKLRAQPTLDSITDLLAMMVGRLEKHDIAFEEVLKSLKDIRVAVVPPK